MLKHMRYSAGRTNKINADVSPSVCFDIDVNLSHSECLQEYTTRTWMCSRATRLVSAAVTVIVLSIGCLALTAWLGLHVG